MPPPMPQSSRGINRLAAPRKFRLIGPAKRRKARRPPRQANDSMSSGAKASKGAMPPKILLGLTDRRDRRGVRRYRHQPALRVPRSAGPGRRRRAGRRRDPRRAQPRLVDAVPRRHGQIRAVPDAREQSRRGRRAGAGGAGAARARLAVAHRDRARRGGRGVVLRRRDDHAGAVGAVGGRGVAHAARREPMRSARRRSC